MFGWHNSSISLALFYGDIPTCWRRWSPTSDPGNAMKIKERYVELQSSEDIMYIWKLGRQGNCWTCSELSDFSHNPEHFLVSGLNVCWHFHFMNCYNVKIVQLFLGVKSQILQVLAQLFWWLQLKTHGPTLMPQCVSEMAVCLCDDDSQVRALWTWKWRDFISVGESSALFLLIAVAISFDLYRLAVFNISMNEGLFSLTLEYCVQWE